ncbi:MAG TPA: hypothetical protein VJB87_01040 [Candidatus Nanoarchaeia archaeon]|nr:hypothetical protein [Candidatus Nanoarchaeia archaeon]
MPKAKSSVHRAVVRSKLLVKNNKFVVGVFGLVIALTILAFVAVTLLRPSSPFEITKNDVFAHPDFSGKTVAVFGVRLGDTMPQVVDALGKADNIESPGNNIENWEYSDALGMEKVGLLLQFRSGVLVRMTFKESFNDYLVGSTKIVHTKDELYSIFGAPSNVRHVQSNSASGRAFQIVTYNTKNFEFILLGDKENGFSIFL